MGTNSTGPGARATSTPLIHNAPADYNYVAPATTMPIQWQAKIEAFRLALDLTGSTTFDRVRREAENILEWMTK